METPQKTTPMMRQYGEIKDNYPETILFFRMGDFYEMFFEDAQAASKIMGIALTSRGDGVPMCGIPYHAYQPYLMKLIRAGKNVAICEQLEDPATAKGIVKRGVVRVVTPGTILEDEGLNSASNNFVAVLWTEKEQIFAAVADISTGQIFLEKCTPANINDITGRWKPAEVISHKEIEGLNRPVSVIDASFGTDTARRRVLEHYSAASEKSLGIDGEGYLKAIALLLTYTKNLMLDVKLKYPVTLAPENRLHLDSIAVKTLELVENSQDGSERNTLFSVLNFCRTSMGARLLKNWLRYPLRSKESILRRLEIVEYLSTQSELRGALFDALSTVYDMERITARLLAGRCSPRDLVWLKSSVVSFPKIKEMLLSAANPHLSETGETFNALEGIYSVIDAAIVDEPPLNIKEGGIIREGYDKNVDELKALRKDSRTHLLRIETEEKKKTGISTLKVKYNKVFGYYIEISKSNLDRVPEYYDRKQTLVNAERFTIPELKELETKLVYAEERLGELEYALFTQVRDTLANYSEMIRASAETVSEIDCLSSLAEAAVRNRYTRPQIGAFEEMDIREGRHPVVEKNITDNYVPNDLYLNSDDSRMAVITGPNMAGKSTYLRMTALVALMAHTGSFVPAAEAKIPLLDRIFTRVGASDNLAGGESTFMVEMTETANILHNATDKSLIILDEIGRGTSTFDGISIAWSVAEYILERLKAKTLFATHYHELTDIPSSIRGAVNLTTEVREWNDEVIFMRRVIRGTADRSYGIHVAKLAGLPDYVINRGYEVLSKLEKNEFGTDGTPKLSQSKIRQEKVVQQMLIFEDSPALDELRSMDINNMTPVEALNTLARLKKISEK
ncbi:DNA mismatch repair protein MutS [Geovibrio thiophilus]|uniref:DNA mismatch repair protein MutS n=1 Tax=Geovibrio thiophilus TaxID=139438 RepID=A0A3R5X4S4_9BACT|nr:DNA mismatch repair protein MutS [Geovibrio thiophilus]